MMGMTISHYRIPGEARWRWDRWGARQVLKNCEVAPVFPSPPFRSSDFTGPRRPRLYGFSRTSGAFRIARDAGGEVVDVNGNIVGREKGD